MPLTPRVTPEGVEPSIAWMKARSPRPLDDGAVIDRAPKTIGSKAKVLDILPTDQKKFHH